MDELTEMLKGTLEGCVLEIIDSEETYGYAITRRLNELGFAEVIEGTVYTILIRLERNGLVQVTKRPSGLGAATQVLCTQRRGAPGARDVLGQVGVPLVTNQQAQGGREMNFWETITGSDLTRECREFEVCVEALPSDYRAAWQEIKVHLLPYGNFRGRNLMPILDGALGLLEETAANGQSLHEVLGSDMAGFCAALAGGEGARSYRDRWREQLNRNVARKVTG